MTSSVPERTGLISRSRLAPSDEGFLARLHLEQIDRDIFTGWCHAGAPMRAFGGQVAAQALVAAGSTVPEAGRRVHSLHSYFLRPGRPPDQIVYLVDRPRDGGTFTTRRVRAVQYGEAIFTMSASFAEPGGGPEHQDTGGDVEATRRWMSLLPDPDRTPPHKWFADQEFASAEDRRSKLKAAGYPSHAFADMRVVPNKVEGTEHVADEFTWLRSIEPLPDDSLTHVCALTYCSDLSLIRTILGHHGGREATQHLQVTSIDHAMWFHRPFRADEWLLFATDSPVADGGRGFSRGQVFTQDGLMIASLAQEALVRLPAVRH